MQTIQNAWHFRVFRTILFLSAVLFLSQAFGTVSANAANPAFVKLTERAQTTNNNNVVTPNFSSSVTNGNLISVWIWYNSNARAVSSVTDTKGNTYTRAVGPTTGTGAMSNWRQEIWYAKNVTGGTSLAVTATFNGTFSAEKAITAHEYSGLDIANPIDATTSAVTTGTNGSTAAIATHFANDLVFGTALMEGSATAGSGFTRRSSIMNNVTEDKIASTIGAYAVSVTNSSQVTILGMVAFKATGATADTQAPSTPTNLAASVISGSQINLNWTASTDNVSVTGYKVFRNNIQIATSSGASYNDSGLNAGTAYTYFVKAFDGANNVSSSSASIVATTTAPDTQSPSIPTNLSATPVSTNQINLAWTASTDNVGVAGYRIFRVNIQIATTSGTTYSDTGLAANTQYSYSVAAYDAAGNISAQSAIVSTSTFNPPPQDTQAPAVSITTPINNSTASGTVAVSATASDNVGVIGVQFKVNGANLGIEDTSSPYSVSWDTTQYANGTYNLTAVGRDAAGNYGTSTTIAVNVSNSTSTLSQGLIGMWQFDEGSGTVASDFSGNGNTGTLTAGAGWTTSRTAGSALSNTAASYVDAGNGASFQTTGSMSFSAWIYATANPADDGQIIAKADGNSGWQFKTSPDTGPHTFAVGVVPSAGGAQTQRYSNTVRQLNTWYNVTGIYNSSIPSLDIYVNGVLDNGALRNGPIPNAQKASTANVNIGQRNGGYNFIGKIDDVRVYNRPLTPTEVVAIYNGSTPTPDTIPPTVAIATPTQNATVTGAAVTLNASSSDNIAVAGVQFKLNGVNLGSEVTSAPYTFSWDSTMVANGTYTLTAIARDASGNSTTSPPVTINVFNSPQSGFQNEILITSLDFPSNILFLPDGSMLIAELGGKIKRVPAGATSPDPTPFLNITNIGRAGGLQGLFTIALDPNFATNHFLYAFYTLGSPNVDRLSRFVAGSTTASLASETVIYQDSATSGTDHHGGGIVFGNDGKLYLSIGDHFSSSGIAQDLSSPHGKVLRLNSDGTVPTDNPFYDGAGSHYDAIYALGLRNPYRMTIDVPTGRILIGDVGGNVYETAREEVDLLARGANYAWPNCESGCATPPYTNAIYDYGHFVGNTSQTRDASITGGFIYRGSQFPAEYYGNYFFGDYTQNWIRRLTFDASGTTVTGMQCFEPTDCSTDGPYGAIVNLAQGPDGSLYYTDIGWENESTVTGGKIRRIKYNNGNLAPIVNATATPITGPAPLSVNFSSAGTSDPENQPLSYAWDFGDGASSTQANPTHVYTVKGKYTVRLNVSDGVQSSLATPFLVQVGTPPVATILTPTNGILFRANDIINFSGSATDAEDGTLPASAFSWQIFFHHNTHIHPTLPFASTTSGSFTIDPAGHDYHDNTSYEIILTVTDSDGLQDSKSVFTYPDKVNLTFNTVPNGLTFKLDGITQTTPFVYDTLIGFQHSIEAPNQATGTQQYNFNSWSDSGTQVHTITVPTTAASFTATYDATSTPLPSGLVGAWNFNENTGITAADHSGNNNNGALVNNPIWVAGKYGSALSFNGSNALVNIPNSASLQLTTGMTLEAWVKPTVVPINWADIIYKDNDNYLLTASTDQARIGAVVTAGGVDQALTGATALSSGLWTHVAATYDGVNLKVYANGNLENTVPLTGNITVSTNPVTIAGDTRFSQYFNGTVDEVRIYNRPLTQTEIQSDMNTPLP
jgi:glucose/arabinose dehydrogenase